MPYIDGQVPSMARYDWLQFNVLSGGIISMTENILGHHLSLQVSDEGTMMVIDIRPTNAHTHTHKLMFTSHQNCPWTFNNEQPSREFILAKIFWYFSYLFGESKQNVLELLLMISKIVFPRQRGLIFVNYFKVSDEKYLEKLVFFFFFITFSPSMVLEIENDKLFFKVQ